MEKAETIRLGDDGVERASALARQDTRACVILPTALGPKTAKWTGMLLQMGSIPHCSASTHPIHGRPCMETTDKANGRRDQPLG